MADDTLTCPGCDKTFRWQTKIAGRVVRCKCGAKFRVPMVAGEPPEAVASRATEPAAPKPPETNPYELNLPDEPSAEPPASVAASAGMASGAGGGEAVRCPACNVTLRPDAVLCLTCGFNLAEGKHVQTVVERDEGDSSFVTYTSNSDEATRQTKREERQTEMADEAVRKHQRADFFGPILFCVGSLVLSAVSLLLLPFAPGGINFDDVIVLVMYAAVRNAVTWVLLVAGLFACASIAGSSAGRLGTALLKAFATAAMMGLVSDCGRLFFAVITEGLGTFGLGAFLRVGAAYAVLYIACYKFFDYEALEVQIMGGFALVLPLMILFWSPLPWGLFY
ncbi:MAG: hypothetical protein AAF710_05460 [Planctomycetota bacterium]